MKKYFFIITLICLTVFSCTKEEGEGGRSSITGTIHMTDINDQTGAVQAEYNAPDHDVYIIYGDDDDIYDDDMKTNYDGTFEFKNLRKGSYRIFTYTQDLTESSLVKAVFKSVELDGSGTSDVGTIEVEK